MPSAYHSPSPRTMTDSQLDTQQQLRAATVGFDYLFANDLTKARETFAGGDSPFHSMGHGVCAFLEAALGMEVRTQAVFDLCISSSLPLTSLDWFDGRSLTPPHRLRDRCEEAAQDCQVLFSDYPVPPWDGMGTTSLRLRHSPRSHPRSQVRRYVLTISSSPDIPWSISESYMGYLQCLYAMNRSVKAAAVI